jgi:SWI/SNF-related matrix-associated actin-dependent regulator of chromatin subfamily A member 5
LLYFSTRCSFCAQRQNGITATLRESGPDDTPEKLEAERAAAQEFIDTAEPLTEEEQALKEKYTEAGFHDWSRRDFQQFVRALENYGWYCILLFREVRY